MCVTVPRHGTTSAPTAWSACLECCVVSNISALQSFDVGVYFEANGHGTVLFSPKLAVDISRARMTGTDRRARAVQRLRACLLLINQTVGDALSDMLLCLVSLQVFIMANEV